jgi:hypothetical protein
MTTRKFSGGKTENTFLVGQTSSVQPSTPTIGTPTNIMGVCSASVPFTAGSGASATSFRVTSSPGSFTATSATSPIVVAGLSSGTTYTFTVIALNAIGQSAASSASSSLLIDC